MSKKEGADFHLNQCSDVSIPDGKVFLYKARLIKIVGDGMRSCIYASPMGGREGL
jgi:hypothetical protein